MTSRELNERVGGFREDPKQVFWLEDEAYIDDIAQLGFGPAVLADLRVHHTGGPHYRDVVQGEDRVLGAATGAARRAGGRSSGMLFRVPFVPGAQRPLRVVRRAFLRRSSPD